MKPITFTEIENRNLQEIFIELSQDATRAQYYQAVLPSIISKIEAYPASVLFTEQENRAIQYLYEGFAELLKPYPYPYSPLTFQQPTVQMEIVFRILHKLKEAAE